jgi:predicted choloylglycine hydrolase
MRLRFEAVAEALPGPRWARHCAVVGPAVERWYFRDGDARRPSFLACEMALARHMPELLPTWRTLTALAGGSDRIARALSLYRPPAFMAGCSQLLWTGAEPALLRNYDYGVDLCEGLVLRSAWTGRDVIASIDVLWGALDGCNADGLAISLAFGGRHVVGDGFGIPLIVRYVLETCSDTAQAIAVLRRVPCHMCYTVSVIDRSGAAATVYLNPDRETVVSAALATTNHQAQVDWPEHAAITQSVERQDALLAAATRAQSTTGDVRSIIAALLQPPLYTRDHARRHATLYTAVYRPAQGELELVWPSMRWHLSFTHFHEQAMEIAL